MATGPRLTLVKWREEAGLTRAEVASAIGIAERTYARCERGETVLRVGQRPALAKILNKTAAELRLVLNGQAPRTRNSVAVPDFLNLHATVEREAAQAWSFQPFTVFALLQTPEYATAVERADATPRTEEGIARRVDVRMSRQDVLTRQPEPLYLSVILDESVLRRVTGGSDVMAGQLDRLVELSRGANVDIQVLPLDAGQHSAGWGGFTILTPEGAVEPRIVAVEDRTGIRYLEGSYAVEPHMAVWEHLADVALPPAETAALISSISKEMYQ